MNADDRDDEDQDRPDETPPSQAPGGEDGQAPPEDYRVGYCRPPLHSRFKEGRSGNPRGRQRRPDLDDEINRLLWKALKRRIADPRRGGRHTISLLDMIIDGIATESARRDPRMIRVLLAMAYRHSRANAGDEEAKNLEAEDQAILEAYLASRLKFLEDGGEGDD